MDSDRMKSALVAAVEARCEELWGIAARLHAAPEEALREFASAALLTACLERAGFAVERGLAGMETAFRATSGESGSTIALLAEMDALPVLGHACGHNIVAACTVGAALALRAVLPAETARFMVIGTPAEEQGVGKVDLVQSGCFEGVDFAMMVHPSSKRQVVKRFLGLAKIRFCFHGRASHAAAYPELGINALDAVIQTFNAINAMRQQLRPDVRIHGIITDGGVAPNIIPAQAACYFYVRASDLDEVQRVKERVIACADGAARATGCRLEVNEDPRVLAPFKVNWALADLYSAQLRYLGLFEENAPPDKGCGSSDIGNVSQVVPTIHPHVPLGAGLRIHTEEFARATLSEQGRQAILEGASALALTAASLATDPAVRKEIEREFENS